MRKSVKKSVDTKSWDLAEHCLPIDASNADKQSLAADIQQAVEDWFDHQAMVGEAQTRFAEILTDGQFERAVREPRLPI